MNIYSYMVVRNEADRYLEETITSINAHVDGVFVLDDYSEDSTLDILRKLHVPHMSNTGTSFMVSEAACRQQAWRYMERTFRPKVGDWILTLDADEYLRVKEGTSLWQICAAAEQDALWLRIHEMWTPTDIRVDGAWKTIRGLRLVAWKPNGQFKPSAMGGGSIPEIAQTKGSTNKADIIHRGYQRPADRQHKYERYSNRPGQHANRHIESILATPMLAPLPQIV